MNPASPDVSLRAALSSKGCRPVAYFTIYTTLTGSVTAGLFLSQCGYWSALAADGWFYHTASQFTAETGMSRREQEMARRKLVALGFLEEKRDGSPARIGFRINEPAIIEALHRQSFPNILQFPSLQLNLPQTEGGEQ